MNGGIVGRNEKRKEASRDEMMEYTLTIKFCLF